MAGIRTFIALASTSAVFGFGGAFGAVAVMGGHFVGPSGAVGPTGPAGPRGPEGPPGEAAPAPSAPKVGPPYFPANSDVGTILSNIIRSQREMYTKISDASTQPASGNCSQEEWVLVGTGPVADVGPVRGVLACLTTP